MIEWEMLYPQMTTAALGFIPYWLNDSDPRGAVEQLDSHYKYGGFKEAPVTGFVGNKEDFSLKYPGDPRMKPLAKATLRDETICFYPGEFLAVWQKDGTFVAARFD